MDRYLKISILAMLFFIAGGYSQGWQLDGVFYYMLPIGDIGIGYNPSQAYQPIIYLTFGTQSCPFKTTDEGCTWMQMPWGYPGAGNDRCVVIHPTNPLIMYKGVPGSAPEARGIIKSTDGGYNWTPVFTLGSIDPNRITIFPETPEIVIFGNGKGQFQIGGGCLYKTTDAGASWVDKTPLQTGGYLFSVTDFYIHPTEERKIYVSADSSNDDPVNPMFMGVWYSADYGDNWDQIGKPGIYGQPYVMEYPRVNCVAVGANSYIYAGFGPTETNPFGGIERSTDGGLSWNTVYTNVDYPVSDILVDPDNDNVIYAAISKIADKYSYFNGQGILKSTNYGATWQPYNEGLGDKYVYQLRVNKYNHNHLYAGTFQSFYFRDRSMTPSNWQRRVNGTIIEPVTNILPTTSNKVYALIQRGLIKKEEIGSPWELVSTIGPDELLFPRRGQVSSILRTKTLF